MGRGQGTDFGATGMAVRSRASVASATGLVGTAYSAFPTADVEALEVPARPLGDGETDGLPVGGAADVAPGTAPEGESPRSGSRKRPRLTDEERAQKRAKERELVRQSVDALLSSEGWMAWLAIRTRFHRYSFHNQLLIASQDPNASRVASLRKWRDELGYAVRKGETSIRIWAPRDPSKTAMDKWKEEGEDPATKPHRYFVLAPVFSDNQVDPLPEPAQPVPLAPPVVEVEGDELQEHEDALMALSTELGYTVEVTDDLPRGAKGSHRRDTRQLKLSAASKPNGRVKTWVHELGHALVAEERETGDAEASLSRAEEELVVESIAMSTCGALGLDTSGYSIPYLASWSRDGDLEVLERVAALTNRLAVRIESSLGL